MKMYFIVNFAGKYLNKQKKFKLFIIAYTLSVPGALYIFSKNNNNNNLIKSFFVIVMNKLYILINLSLINMRKNIYLM